MDTNGLGGVAARYCQSLDVDEPLIMLRSGATSYYQVDGLGSVTSLSNASSSLAQSYGYDACGLMQLPQIGQPHRQFAPADLQFQSVRVRRTRCHFINSFSKRLQHRKLLPSGFVPWYAKHRKRRTVLFEVSGNRETSQVRRLWGLLMDPRFNCEESLAVETHSFHKYEGMLLPPWAPRE